MKVSGIVALSENGIIGKKGKIPWHLPNDLKQFRNLTEGHCVVMGRKTYESIGRPLSNRTNIVITRGTYPGVVITPSFEWALEFARFQKETELFVIGGAQVYKAAEPFMARLYVTVVHTQIEGDTSFPISLDNWILQKVELHSSDDKHQYCYSFKLYECESIDCF